MDYLQYILEIVFVILYITFFSFIFNKKVEGIIIILLLILSFFAGGKTINDLYKSNLAIKFDFLRDTKPDNNITFIQRLLNIISNISLPLWILTSFPILLSTISLLLIILTILHVKKKEKNYSSIGTINLKGKYRKLLNGYKILFICNFVFIVLFILGSILSNTSKNPNSILLLMLAILYIIISVISGIMMADSTKMFKIRTSNLISS
jgi:hypothetical protein